MNTLSIGKGNDLFHFTVKLEEIFHFDKLTLNANTDNKKTDTVQAYWLSYDSFGAIIQTPKFDICNDKNQITERTNGFVTFTPVADTFCIKSCPEEMDSFFETKMTYLQIHVCCDGTVLGSVTLHLGPTFSGASAWETIPTRDPMINNASTNNLNSIQMKQINGIFVVKDTNYKEPSNQTLNDAAIKPSIKIGLLLKRIGNISSIGNQFKTNKQTMSSNHVPDVPTEPEIRQNSENDGYTSDKTDQEQLRMKDVNIAEELACNQSSRISQKLNESDYINGEQNSRHDIDIERRTREWEEWRHQQELKWHEKLREKEEAAIRALEEHSKARENERMNLMEASRLEYVRLETKLKKSLADIEHKDRQLKHEQSIRESEYKRKQFDLDVKLKMIREEAKHLLELEKARGKSFLERAETAELSLKVAQNRLHELETQFHRYKEKQHQTPEATLIQEIATLKGQSAEMESRNERTRADHNQLLLEKEKLSNHVYRLSKALRCEKEKTHAKARKEVEELRLQYVAREQRFILDGERNELQRIKRELKTLVQNSSDHERMDQNNLYKTPPRSALQRSCASVPNRKYCSIQAEQENIEPKQS